MMNSKLLFIYNIFRLLLPDTGLFALKSSFLQYAGVKIGKNVQICSSTKIVGIGNLDIGDNTWIGLDVMIISSGNATINIGKNVDIAPQVFIGTGSHQICTEDNRVAGVGTNKDVTIGDGTWIGARATILPGVHVGKMCMIAAGALISKDVPDYTIVGGVPAKVLKRLK